MPVDIEYGSAINQPIESLSVSLNCRFIHYLVDVIIIRLIYGFVLVSNLNSFHMSAPVEFILNNPIKSQLLTGFLYYLLNELFFGRTLGKVLTGSVVVNEKGRHPGLLAILLRSLCRYVPFEQISVLGNNDRMWHDSWSKTLVVKQKQLKEFLNQPGPPAPSWADRNQREARPVEVEPIAPDQVDKAVFSIASPHEMRFSHFLIDTIVPMALILVIYWTKSSLYLNEFLDRLNGWEMLWFLMGAVSFYIFMFESICGQTLGKLATGSIVVNQKGNRPAFWVVLLRTLIRWVPFEQFSMLSGSGRMWHDTWTKTVVVKKEAYRELQARIDK